MTTQRWGIALRIIAFGTAVGTEGCSTRVSDRSRPHVHKIQGYVCNYLTKNRSTVTVSRTKGRCTFTATSSPVCSRPRYTYSMNTNAKYCPVFMRASHKDSQEVHTKSTRDSWRLKLCRCSTSALKFKHVQVVPGVSFNFLLYRSQQQMR